jgi:hypothetical protein
LAEAVPKHLATMTVDLLVCFGGEARRVTEAALAALAGP